MDIPDNLLGKLMDINDDLKRAGRIDWKPRGSPTNLYFELANGLGIVGAHSIMQAGRRPVRRCDARRHQRVKNRLANMRLNQSGRSDSLNYPPPAFPQSKSSRSVYPAYSAQPHDAAAFTAVSVALAAEALAMT